MIVVAKLKRKWNNFALNVRFKSSLLEAYLEHLKDDLIFQKFLIKIYIRNCFIKLILLETFIRKFCLFFSLNLLFWHIYSDLNKSTSNIDYFIIALALFAIYMFWKKSISTNIREKVAYSGFEDENGWIVIDNVELVNEPDNRIWKVVSTCGNVAKFLLLIRRNSITKYTVVVVPSCVASAILGRYIPGVVLLHLASISVLTWPYISLFPFIFYGMSKYGCKKLVQCLSYAIPQSYKRIRNIKISKPSKCIKDKEKGDQDYNLKINNSNEHTEKNYSQCFNLKCLTHLLNYLTSAKTNDDKIIPSNLNSNTDAQNINETPGDNFKNETQFIQMKIMNIEDTKKFLKSLVILDDNQNDLLDLEFLPDFDEKTAYILEEASEALSTSSSEIEREITTIPYDPHRDTLSLSRLPSPSNLSCLDDEDQLDDRCSISSSASSYVRGLLDKAIDDNERISKPFANMAE
ncbi:uncharacterized protein LOC135923219 isoform X2 [Gordionus sp. m RMFG-2023]|uniref:uncharacterized protein LOC135923219 isoform X2 n=1 Tax=Gordionus sp. m RMFG-2023 TaxID=3053472 RepID=UPI0031FE2E86